MPSLAVPVQTLRGGCCGAEPDERWGVGVSRTISEGDPPAESFYVCLLDSVTREIKAAGITDKTSMVLTEAAQRKLYGTTMSMIYFEVVGQAPGERDSTAASLAITLPR